MNFVRFAHREGVPQQVPDIQHPTLSNPFIGDCKTNMSYRSENKVRCCSVVACLGTPSRFGKGTGVRLASEASTEENAA